MAKALSKFWNLITAAAPETEIRNNTGQHIFLIPLSCLDGCDPRQSGTVKKDKVKVIPQGESIKVQSQEYDCNLENPDSQIYILFRAREDGDIQNFLRDLEVVQVQEGEALFLHFHLLRFPQFFLNFNREGQLRREDAGQEDAAVTGNESELTKLIQGIQKYWKELENKVEAKVKPPKNKMKTLKEDSAK